MEKVQMDLKTLYHFPYINIKDNTVFRKGFRVYKYDTNSKKVMDYFDNMDKGTYTNRLALAKAYMYNGDMYIGYIMRYYQFLYSLRKSICDGRIKSAYDYFNELLKMIEFLNSRDICYWDFHTGNVKVTRSGHPFLLDLSDSSINPGIDDVHLQSEYLAMFIMNIYLDDVKSTNNYITLLDGRHILSEKAISYLYDTIDLASQGLSLPYIILEEMNNRDVCEEIKKLIK